MRKYKPLKLEYRYIVAAIYAVVLFLDRLDLTIVNIALPTIAKYFHIPISQTEWVNNAYLLALTISIPISSWIGDRFGNKKIFIFATLFFGGASFLCAFAPNITALAILRFIQGLGGGIIVPVGMTMVYRVFKPSEYASVTSFIFMPTLIAPAISPALGGLMIHYAGWEWVFLFALPLCFIAAIAAIFMIKEQPYTFNDPLDWHGFILSSCALMSMLYFISSLGNSNNYFKIFGLLLSTIFFIYRFIKHETQIKFPLIDLKFFQNKLFVQANLIQLAFQICHYGSMFLIAMYLQVAAGMSALSAGLIMGTQAIGAICISRFTVKLFHKSGPSLPIIVGFCGVAVFTSCILCITNTGMIKTGIAILFVRGLFSGLCGNPIQTSGIIGFAKEDVGRANSIFNTCRQIAISIGIALASLLINFGFKIYHLEGLKTLHANYHAGFYYAFILIPIVCCLGIIVTLQIDNKKILDIIEHHKANP